MIYEDPIELPGIGKLGCRLLIKVLVVAARVEELSVSVPVPQRRERWVLLKIPRRDIDGLGEEQ